VKLVLASSNAGKLAELRNLLGDRFELHAQSEFAVEDAEETGLSFIENAILKARHAARRTGLPSLGDDSGLCVDALDGAPGLYSARYAGGHGDSEANIDKLLRALDGVADERRHQQGFRFDLGNAARHQIEFEIVVERARRRAVAALHIVGENLQLRLLVRFRVARQGNAWAITES